MKKTLKLFVLGLVTIFALNVQAQAQEEESSWSLGADLTTTYVWRGIYYSGPSFQPYVEYSKGIFAIGAWGNQGFDGFQEMDLYASLSFDFGLSLGLTDYYYPGGVYAPGEGSGAEYFDTSKESGAHALELNASYSIGALSLAGNYIFNEAGGAASAGGDLYFEVGATIGKVDLFVGAGDGWHTTDGDFGLSNIGISTSKEIKITDSFSLPISGSVVLNPDSEQFYVIGTISF